MACLEGWEELHPRLVGEVSWYWVTAATKVSMLRSIIIKFPPPVNFSLKIKTFLLNENLNVVAIQRWCSNNAGKQKVGWNTQAHCAVGRTHVITENALFHNNNNNNNNNDDIEMITIWSDAVRSWADTCYHGECIITIDFFKMYLGSTINIFLQHVGT